MMQHFGVIYTSKGVPLDPFYIEIFIIDGVMEMEVMMTHSNTLGRSFPSIMDR